MKKKSNHSILFLLLSIIVLGLGVFLVYKTFDFSSVYYLSIGAGGIYGCYVIDGYFVIFLPCIIAFLGLYYFISSIAGLLGNNKKQLKIAEENHNRQTVLKRTSINLPELWPSYYFEI